MITMDDFQALDSQLFVIFQKAGVRPVRLDELRAVDPNRVPDRLNTYEVNGWVTLGLDNYGNRIAGTYRVTETGSHVLSQQAEAFKRSETAHAMPTEKTAKAGARG